MENVQKETAQEAASNKEKARNAAIVTASATAGVALVKHKEIIAAGKHVIKLVGTLASKIR